MPGNNIIFDNTNNLWRYDVTIAAGAAVSDAIATEGSALVGLRMPTAWTAAALGFQAAMDPSDVFLSLYNAGGTLEQATVAASQWILFPCVDAPFVPFLRLTSVAAGTTTGVNQVAAASIGLVFRRYLS